MLENMQAHPHNFHKNCMLSSYVCVCSKYIYVLVWLLQCTTNCNVPQTSANSAMSNSFTQKSSFLFLLLVLLFLNLMSTIMHVHLTLEAPSRCNLAPAKRSFTLHSIKSMKCICFRETTVQQQFSANNSASVWRGLRQITNYKPWAPHSINNSCLANDLNEFSCRLERQLRRLFPFRRERSTDFSRGRTPAKQLGQNLSLQPPSITVLTSCLWYSPISITPLWRHNNNNNSFYL